MASTIRANHAHLIGLGRPSVMYPNLPRILLSSTDEEVGHLYFPDAPQPPPYLRFPVPVISAGFGTAWHCALMLRMAKNQWKGLGSSSNPSAGPETVEGVTKVEQARLPEISTLGAVWDAWFRN